MAQLDYLRSRPRSYPVSISCEVLEVSARASGYFTWQRCRDSIRPEGHGAQAGEQLDSGAQASVPAP